MSSPLQPLRLRLGRLLLGWGERLLSGIASGTAETKPALFSAVASDPVGSRANATSPAETSMTASSEAAGAVETGEVGAREAEAPPAVGRPAATGSAPQPPLPPPQRPTPPLNPGASPVDAAPLTPALRRPISIEKAVLNHDLRVLRREAADALAALGAAHALVSSARLAQVQELRQQIGQGGVSEDTLLNLAADYQGWMNDQVRLFDALSMVMRMRIPAGRVLDQVDPAMRPQARSHLEMLCLEYERQQLNQRFPQQAPPDRDPQS